MKERINHILSLPIRISVFSVLLFSTPCISFTQCIVAISSFPYNENFESSNGNWVEGGSSSDWVWGRASQTGYQRCRRGFKMLDNRRIKQIRLQ
jgi:hypothetical protein